MVANRSEHSPGNEYEAAQLKPVLSIGEILIDLIAADEATSLEEVGSFVASPGGAPANVAVALARLGTPSAFCGVVGDDPFGKRLRATLDMNGVETSRLHNTSEADTTVAFAWKDERGDGHFRILRMADRLLNVELIDQAAIQETAAIVLGSVSLTEEPSSSAIRRALELATKACIPMCLDVNMRPTLWTSNIAARDACLPVIQQATLLKLSFDDAKFLFGSTHELEAIFATLSELNRPFTVLTDGARGAWFARSTNRGLAFEHVPPFNVTAIEPTGAGDAFTAAIISRLIVNNWKRLDTDDARFASAAGALTTTRRGAIDSLPTLNEVNEFLSSTGR
jgi:sugar/nucleoside kinase (ribokinase family)